MFEKILIPTDMTNESLVIVEFLGQLRAIGTKECFIVECIQAKEAMYGFSKGSESISPALKEKKQFLEGLGFKTTVETVIGNILAEIKRISEENQCSLTVLGMRKTSLAKEIFFSDISNFIAKNTHSPALIIPLDRRKKDGIFCLRCETWNIKKHLLFPTDFSLNADLAFGYLQEIVKTGVEKVTLLHIQDKAKIGGETGDLEKRLRSFNEIDAGRLENLKDKLAGASEVDIKISYGLPVHEIMKVIEEDGVSQVVMGSQGRGYINEIFMGSVSHKIARMADVPVLLVPMKR